MATVFLWIPLCKTASTRNPNELMKDSHYTICWTTEPWSLVFLAFVWSAPVSSHPLLTPQPADPRLCAVLHGGSSVELWMMLSAADEFGLASSLWILLCLPVDVGIFNDQAPLTVNMQSRNLLACILNSSREACEGLSAKGGQTFDQLVFSSLKSVSDYTRVFLDVSAGSFLQLHVARNIDVNGRKEKIAGDKTKLSPNKNCLISGFLSVFIFGCAAGAEVIFLRRVVII